MVKKFSNQMSTFVTYIHHIYLVNVYIVILDVHTMYQNGLVKFMMVFLKQKKIKLFYFVLYDPNGFPTQSLNCN